MSNKFIRSAARAREWLKNNDYPYSDEIPLVPSHKALEEGGHYALLIPAITSLKMARKVIQLLKATGINRAVLVETHGSLLLTDTEIKEMLICCAEEGFGLMLSTGPRPEFDRKATFFRSQSGMEQGRRLNNNDAIACTIEETLKVTSLGCRGIVIYDIGILKILNDMRAKQLLPADLILAASTHCGISNSVTASVFANLGADNIIPLHDVALPVLQDMRRILPNSVTLSVPIDTYPSKGGFLRYYEIPEIVQIASPVFLKLGASVQDHPYAVVDDAALEKRVDRIVLGVEQLKKVNLPVTEMSLQSKHWCFPCINSNTNEKNDRTINSEDGGHTSRNPSSSRTSL